MGEIQPYALQSSVGWNNRELQGSMLVCKVRCSHYRTGVAHATQGVPPEIAHKLVDRLNRCSCRCYMEGYQDGRKGTVVAVREGEPRWVFCNCNWNPPTVLTGSRQDSVDCF